MLCVQLLQLAGMSCQWLSQPCLVSIQHDALLSETTTLTARSRGHFVVVVGRCEGVDAWPRIKGLGCDIPETIDRPINEGDGFVAAGVWTQVQSQGWFSIMCPRGVVVHLLGVLLLIRNIHSLLLCFTE